MTTSKTVDESHDVGTSHGQLRCSGSGLRELVPAYVTSEAPPQTDESFRMLADELGADKLTGT